MKEFYLKIKQGKSADKLYSQIVLFFKRKKLNYTDFNGSLGLHFIGDDFAKNKLTLVIKIP